MSRFSEYESPDETLVHRAAFQSLVREALALCQAADPHLGAELARLLRMERPSTAAGQALDSAAALRTCFRMLTYARVEANGRGELFHWTEKLDLCIEQLADRLRPEQVSGSAAPRLHS